MEENKVAYMSWRGGDLISIDSEGMRTVIDAHSRLASRVEELQEIAAAVERVAKCDCQYSPVCELDAENICPICQCKRVLAGAHAEEK